MAIVQRLSDNAPELSGGVTGVGGTVALREFLDINADGTANNLLGSSGSTLARVSRPSTAYGVGTGLAALAGWWLTGRGALNDYLLAHGITGIPSGAVSAALPKQASGSTATTSARGTRTRSRSTTRRATADGGSTRSGVSDVGPVRDIN